MGRKPPFYLPKGTGILQRNIRTPSDNPRKRTEALWIGAKKAETITGNGREATAGNTSAFAGSHRTIAPNVQFEQSI